MKKAYWYWAAAGLGLVAVVVFWPDIKRLLWQKPYANPSGGKPGPVTGAGTSGNTGTVPPKVAYSASQLANHPTYGKNVDKTVILYNGIPGHRDEVERLQVYMWKDGRGDIVGAIDGVFGHKTAAALKAQKGVYQITLADYEK